MLVDDGRIVLIDLPQIVDIVINPQGREFLARDCRNIATWFARRGVAADADELEALILEARPDRSDGPGAGGVAGGRAPTVAL